VIDRMLSGELPLPPIDHLTGLRPLAASAGATTFAMPATAWLCAPPPGRALGGAVALLAETALSTAIQTMQPAVTAVAPIDLKVNNLWATEA
jgi:acyl-coenzyme A thioesterase PaaI-like protein